MAWRQGCLLVPVRKGCVTKRRPKSEDGADTGLVSLRMLWNREDAEDATQEILVRIITRLTQFDFRSQLKTWAYRRG